MIRLHLLFYLVSIKVLFLVADTAWGSWGKKICLSWNRSYWLHSKCHFKA